MVVTLEQIQAGILKYIDIEVAPKATGLSKFLVYFIAPSIPKNVTQYVQALKSNTAFTDLFDESGNMKIDDVYVRAKEAIKHSGKILIPQFNYFIDESDIDKLYNLIKTS